jgi:8-oxo-dGTP diphosphatase
MPTHDPNFVPTKNYFVVGQKAIVRNNQGDLLLLQRSEKSGAGGQWSLPGGGLEKDEDPVAGIRREILEETGLTVTNIVPFLVRSYSENDDAVVIIGYYCSAVTTSPRLNWEHTNYEWVSKASALQKELTSDGRYFIENSS